MSEPQLVNEAQHAVDEALQGCVLANPQLRLLPHSRVVIRRELVDDPTAAANSSSHPDAAAAAAGFPTVALVSGGGSGHEPAHAGFVGQGMLTAAVCGDVFASPTPNAVLAALRHCARRCAGALLIVKNYTGDRLNFGLAAEQAKSEGLPTDMVFVADDCGIVGKTAGRRGLAGTLFVHKIAGAAAERGASLAEVAAAAKATALRVGTMGVSLSPCVVPGRPASFELPAGEMELGLGIHGEPGARRCAILTADETVEIMLTQIIGFCTEGSAAPAVDWEAGGRRVALMVNNLGGTSNLELGILARAAVRSLAAKGFVVERVLAGTFMTSIAMKGVSLTLMRVDGNAYGDVPFLELLNDPAATPAWPATLPAHLRSADALSSSTLETRAQAAESAAVSEMAPADRALGSTVTCSAEQGAATAAAIRQACEALLAAVPELTELDRASGDGDCGHTMAAGAESILKGLQPDADAAVALPLTCPPQLLSRLAACMSKFMGGSSGAIYSIMFSAAAGRLAKAEKQASVQDWAEALDAGVQAIALYGGAVRGDRTCLDAFLPATEALLGSLESGEAAKAALTAAAIAARAGAAETASMQARAGRASYVEKSRYKGTADPGAVAAATWLEALAKAFP